MAENAQLLLRVVASCTRFEHKTFEEDVGSSILYITGSSTRKKLEVNVLCLYTLGGPKIYHKAIHYQVSPSRQTDAWIMLKCSMLHQEIKHFHVKIKTP